MKKLRRRNRQPFDFRSLREALSKGKSEGGSIQYLLLNITEISYYYRN